MSKKCTFCGAVMEDHDMFCDECGKKYDDEAVKRAEETNNSNAEAEQGAKQPPQPPQPSPQPHLNVPTIQMPAQAPYTNPVAQAPYTNPVAQAPYTNPVAQAPYTNPVAQAPYGNPTAQAPYGNPAAQAPYGNPAAQAPYGNPMTHNSNNTKKREDWFAISSLIIGASELPLTVLLPFLAVFLPIPGIILGVLGLKSEKKTLAIIGIVLSSLFILLLIIVGIFVE